MSKSRFTRRIPNAQSKVRPSESQEVDGEDAFDLTAALGSETRWKIVRALAEDTLTIQELTEEVDLSKGTVSVHVQQLEDVGVVGSRFNVSDSGGVEKEVALVLDEVVVKLSDR
ncbi:transcriptional regulator [Saliphagus sp. LR7]|uniref:ArsR/SmtB family transcription factor n=1 Tax=Saliphagus sp. LR7 TaxID=2282654 RepID=UPI00130098EB|nr:winged helix-turn-helix domain-containing protein [Saliphagus sp. LR7]